MDGQTDSCFYNIEIKREHFKLQFSLVVVCFALSIISLLGFTAFDLQKLSEHLGLGCPGRISGEGIFVSSPTFPIFLSPLSFFLNP